MAIGPTYITISNSINALYQQLDSSPADQQVTNLKENHHEQISEIFKQIIPFLQQIKNDTPDVDLNQQIIGLKVLFEQDKRIYAIVSERSQDLAIHFRTYRLKNQITMLGTCKTEYFANDLLEQIKENLTTLAHFYYEGLLEEKKWAVIKLAVESLVIPSFISDKDIENNIKNGIFKGQSVVINRCTKLQEMFSKMADDTDEISFEFQKQQFVEFSKKTLELAREQDFSFKKLTEKLTQTPLFFEQHEQLCQLFDQKIPKQSVELRVACLKMQLEADKQDKQNNKIDLRTQIRAGIDFFIEKKIKAELTTEQQAIILSLLYMKGLIPNSVLGELQPEILFLDQLKKVQYTADVEAGTSIVIEFEELTRKFHQEKIPESNWKNACLAIFKNKMTYFSPNEFLKICLKTDAKLAFEFIKERLKYANEDKKNFPLSLTFFKNEKLTQDFFPAFKKFVDAYQNQTNISWNEFCRFFTSGSLSFSKLFEDTSPIVPEQLSHFLGSCYYYECHFRDLSGQSCDDVHLYGLLDQIFACVKKQPSLIANIRPYLACTLLEAKKGAGVKVLESLRTIDFRSNKTTSDIEEFYLILARVKHLHSLSKNIVGSLFDEHLKEKFKKLAMLFQNGAIDVEAWRAVLKKIIDNRNTFATIQYDNLWNIAVAHKSKPGWFSRSKPPISFDISQRVEKDVYKTILETLQNTLKSRQEIQGWLGDLQPQKLKQPIENLLKLINEPISAPIEQYTKISTLLKETIDSKAFQDQKQNCFDFVKISEAVEILNKVCEIHMAEVTLHEPLKILVLDMIKQGLAALEKNEPSYSFYLAEGNLLLIDSEIQKLAIKTTFPSENELASYLKWGHLPFRVGYGVTANGRKISIIRVGTLADSINSVFKTFVANHRILFINPPSGIEYPKNVFQVKLGFHLGEKYSSQEFKDAFLQTIKSNKNGYSLPQNWLEDDAFTTNLGTICNRVHDIFFSNFIVLSKEDCQHFNLAFNTLLIDQVLKDVDADTLIIGPDQVGNRVNLYNAFLVSILYLLTGKEGVEYDEFLNVLTQTTSIGLSEMNLKLLLDFTKFLKNPNHSRMIQNRLNDFKRLFHIQGLELPFENKLLGSSAASQAVE